VIINHVKHEAHLNDVRRIKSQRTGLWCGRIQTFQRTLLPQFSAAVMALLQFSVSEVYRNNHHLFWEPN